MTDEKEQAILDAWERTWGQGEPVTLTQISRETGTTYQRVKNLLDRRGLYYERCSRAKAAEISVEKRRENGNEQKASPYHVRQESGDTVRAMRVRAIYFAPGTGPKNQRPGSEYPPGTWIRVQCAMCGAWMVICPTTHGYFIRRRDGTIAWVCAPCGGSYPRGSVNLGCFAER